MEEITISLQRRIRQRVLLLLGVVFLATTMTILYFVDILNQSSEEKELLLKHRMIEQVFNGYLARAEDEMNLIGQDLSLSHYESGRELDLLFSHHNMLFFGKLDFFYIEWKGGADAMDPRARLFTKIDFQPILKKGLINRWVPVYTKDDSVLLMRKKQIVSDEQKNIGFLYGFISLNDNLTLTNELLDAAQVNAMNIYDNSNKNFLLKERYANTSLPNSGLSSSLPFTSPIRANLQLNISQKNVFSFAIFMIALPFILMVSFILFAFYLLLTRQIKSLIFTPLEAISYCHEEKLLPFKELQPIQLKNNQNKSLIDAKDYRFKLLTESIHCAIIFCNEVTEVEMMNAEAKVLFPDSDKARTIFDFMPISCHQAIQEALKGEIGVTFDLTINNRGRIYKWQAYSFINESAYQGLLLVGRNTTKETSLIWQLEQLQPLSVSIQKRVDTEAIFNELAYLSQLPCHITAEQFQGWIRLLISVLDNISHIESDVSYLPIGEVISEESSRVMATMGIEANRALLDCPLDISVKVIAVNESFRSLIRVVFMMVMSNEMAERSVNVRLEHGEFEFIVMHDMTSRPLFFWMTKMLLANLGGEQKTLRNNALQLNLVVKESEVLHSFEPLPPHQVIAWVANDYPNPAAIKEALINLGLNVKEYVSTGSFFTQSSEVDKFDVMLIGCDKEADAQLDMTRALKLKYGRNQLPIVWLNSTFPMEIDPDVFTVQGCPFDYSLHQVLLKACQLEGIVPMQSNAKKFPCMIVGGSRVGKAIWYTELEKYDTSIHWLTSLANYEPVLSLYKDASIVLLERQPDALLRNVQAEFPNIHLFSIQSWAEMPDNVTFIEMKQPYSGEQIRAFAQNILWQNE